MEKVVRTVCQACHAECGVLVSVDAGRVTGIRGDPNHPGSRGFICVKGINYARFAEHPDRVRHPLRRAGRKGGASWERVSWDEALDGIAAELTRVRETYGARSMGTFHGTAPRQSLFFCRLLASALGTPNVGNTDLHICHAPSMVAEFATMGATVMQEQGPDYLSSQCVLVCGANPTISHPPRGRDLREGIKRNKGKLIVIDPRRTELAATADIWLQLRPGTAVALVLAMLHTIISEGLYDKAFVERYCHGFEELRVRVGAYPPEKVAEAHLASGAVDQGGGPSLCRHETCGHPPPRGHRAGAQLDPDNPCPRHPGLNHGQPGGQGGNLLPTRVPGFITTGGVVASCKLPPEIAAERLGAAEYPLIAGKDPAFLFVHAALASKAMLAGEPYPLKALLLAGGNPVVNMQNTRRTWEAFKSPELLVVLDFFMTPTAELADYVLPATTWLERDDCCDEMYQDCIAARQKAIEPPPECRDDVQIAIDLAERLPWADRRYLPWKTAGEFNTFRVEGMGITFEEFKERGYISFDTACGQYEEKGFATPTGKVELYSTIFAGHGYDPLPIYVEPPQSPVSTPALFREYPYILITGGRIIEYYHASGREIEPLRKRAPDPLLEMHPDAARKEGLQDGDWVWVETPLVRGERVRLRVRCTVDLDPRVVHGQHGWWFPERPGPDHGCFESNINVILTDDPPREPICGSVPLRGTLCRFSKAAP